MGRIAKWLGGLIVVVVIGAILWLAVAPPAMIRVATNYAAKIVCSSVFVSGRDADAVMGTDVQAPGHPIFRFITVNVERDAQPPQVSAGLFGFLGQGHAIWRGEKLGCSSVPDGATVTRIEEAFPATPSVDADALWPDGERAEPSQDAAIAEILDNGQLTGPGMRGVVVVHNGRIIGERYGTGFDADVPLLGWSMTKSVTAAIIGTVVGSGKLSLDQAGLFEGWKQDERSKVTLASMMGMASGLAWNEGYGAVSDVTRMLYLEGDMAAFAASKPYDLVHGNPDGDRLFNYSSGTTVMLSDVWMRAVSQPISYPWEALFKPVGMASATFETDASGTFVGSSYLYATPRDWARFGQFLLQGGTWKGEALLPPDYVTWMTSPEEASKAAWGGYEYGHQVWLVGPEGGTPKDENPDAGFELPEDAFWMLGHDGQSVAVVPSRNLVVVRMGLTPSSLGYKPQALVGALAKAVMQ